MVGFTRLIFAFVDILLLSNLRSSLADSEQPCLTFNGIDKSRRLTKAKVNNDCGDDCECGEMTMCNFIEILSC